MPKHSSFQQRAQKVIAELRPIDNDFMQACVQAYPECVQSMLRVIMDMPQLVVPEPHAQHFLANHGKHSLTLDVFARDSQERLINIETQVISGGSSDASQHRARFHQALMDARHLDESKPFKSLPDNWVIFIVDRDVLGYGLPIYRIERIITANGKPFGDGTRIIYVNCAIQDGSPLGSLAHDLLCAAPAKMRSEEWASRSQSLKCGERKHTMSEGLERHLKEFENELRDELRAEFYAEGRAEGRAEGLRDTVRKLVASGAATPEAAARALGLDVREVLNLAEQTE